MLSMSNMIPSEVKEIVPMTNPIFAGLIFLFSALIIVTFVIIFILIIRTCYWECKGPLKALVSSWTCGSCQCVLQYYGLGHAYRNVLFCFLWHEPMKQDSHWHAVICVTFSICLILNWKWKYQPTMRVSSAQQSKKRKKIDAYCVLVWILHICLWFQKLLLHIFGIHL